jgi:hypothetical protein
MNKHLIIIFSIVCIFCSTSLLARDEISLFDSKGNAKAYFTEDLTIYLWDGDPVAYLHKSGNYFHIYGFNGNHLGWFEGGIIWDHDGNAVGCIKGTVNMIYSIEPVKGIKSIYPIKSIREIASIKPLFSKNGHVYLSLSF